MDNFFAIIWGVIFVVGGISIWIFLYSSLHEKLHDQKDQSAPKNKAITTIFLLVLLFLVLSIAFGQLR